jgi:hypothetical protein
MLGEPGTGHTDEVDSCANETQTGSQEMKHRPELVRISFTVHPWFPRSVGLEMSGAYYMG